MVAQVPLPTAYLAVLHCLEQGLVLQEKWWWKEVTGHTEPASVTQTPLGIGIWVTQSRIAEGGWTEQVRVTQVGIFDNDKTGCYPAWNSMKRMETGCLCA